MQQAARVANYTAFMNMNPETRAGQLVEYGETDQILEAPRDEHAGVYRRQIRIGHEWPGLSV